jgi:transposase
MMRKRHSAAFKAKIVQELLREEKPLREIAAQYGIHPSQLSKWRATVIEALPSLFEGGARHKEKGEPDHEQETNELYAEIGRLTTKLAWIKKQSGLDI